MGTLQVSSDMGQQACSQDAISLALAVATPYSAMNHGNGSVYAASRELYIACETNTTILPLACLSTS